jgi:hypothetical protein
MSKYLLAGAVICALAAPCFAAAEYWIAQDAATHKCAVTQTKPDGKTMVMIGKASYPSQADADAALKAAKECKM